MCEFNTREEKHRMIIRMEIINVRYIDKSGCNRCHQFTVSKRLPSNNKNEIPTIDCASQSQRLKCCDISTSSYSNPQIDESCSPVMSKHKHQDCLQERILKNQQCMQTDEINENQETNSSGQLARMIFIFILVAIFIWGLLSLMICHEEESLLYEPELIKASSQSVLIETFEKCQDKRFSITIFEGKNSNSSCNKFMTRNNLAAGVQKQHALRIDEAHMEFLRRKILTQNCDSVDLSSIDDAQSILDSNSFLSIQLLTFKHPSEVFHPSTSLDKDAVLVSIHGFESSCIKFNWNFQAARIHKRNIHIREVLILPANIDESNLISPQCVASWFIPWLFSDGTCQSRVCSNYVKKIKDPVTFVTTVFSVLYCH